MTLVSGNDGSGRRVGPKVFADVPSQSELMAAQAEVSRVKQGRAMMLLVTCLFAGALVIAGAGAAFLYSQNAQYAPQIEELSEENAILRENADEYASYTNIQDLRNRIQEQRAQIDTFLADKEGARTLIEEREGQAYLNPPTWGAVSAQTVASLEAELAALREDWQAVQRYVPPRPPRAPSSPSTPSTPGSPG